MLTTLRFLHGLNGRRGPADMAHDFVVKPLPKPRLLAPKPYEYHCIRCGWSFLFNRPRGHVTALDHSRSPLDEPGNTARSRTFASGPCPALYKLAQPVAAEPKRRHSPPSPKQGVESPYPQVVWISKYPQPPKQAAAQELTKGRE